MKSLRDVRVIDVSQVLAGPFAAMMLGDLGCDVIKVEPPAGEATRHSFGTPASWGETPGFLSVNRNKRSMTLDLKSDRGQAIFHKLVARSDVVIQNFGPGVAERLGIAYEQLRSFNEKLVFCPISAFEPSGPYARRTAYDIIAQAMSGIMSVTGEAGGAPCRCGVPVADIGTGLVAAFGILAALVSREETGRGCVVQTNLLDSSLAFAVWDQGQYWYHGEVPKPFGSGHPLNAPYQAFRCADGYVTIGANNESLWQRFCEALKHPEWEKDPRFEFAAQRVLHREELVAEIESALANKKRSEVEQALEPFGVPVGAVRTFDEVFDGEEHAVDGMVQEAQYSGRTVKFLGSPLKFNGSRIKTWRPPPGLGEHTDEILTWLGLAAEEVEDLRSKGVVNS